jgi:hypothetical protein
MATKTRFTMVKAALGLALLGIASSALAEDPDPTDSDTDFQEEHGTYPLFVDGVSAVLRIEGVYASVTTRVDGPALENWHMVVLHTQCDGGVIPNRAIVLFKTSMKVTYRCPNPDPALYPPTYFIASAQATLHDIDDAALDPDHQEPANSLLVSVDLPGPDDVVPPRPVRSSEEQEH